MKKIAVVEDNPDNRMLVSALLEDDYIVIEFENGPEALSGLAERPADLILLDISLPGMDGTEVLAKLRAHSDLQEIPVVALTAHAMVGDREKFLDQGFDGYVSKPIVDENELFDTIATLLDGSALTGT